MVFTFFYSFAVTNAQQPLPVPTASPAESLEAPVLRPDNNPVSIENSQGVTTGSISGTVRGPDGEPIPNAQITVRNKNDGTERTTVTDETGRFRVDGLVPGPYQVRMSMPGFSVAERDVLLELGRSATADFTIGSDVPVGTPSPPVGGGGGRSGSPRSAQRAFDIQSKTFDRDIELANWLTLMKRERKRVVKILYVRDQTSLFILETVKAGKNFEYTVMPVNESLDADHLSTRISQNSRKTFVGIHRISDNSYLMVFYD